MATISHVVYLICLSFEMASMHRQIALLSKSSHKNKIKLKITCFERGGEKIPKQDDYRVR